MIARNVFSSAPFAVHAVSGLKAEHNEKPERKRKRKQKNREEKNIHIFTSNVAI
jgi:hypothetical protein